MNLNIFRSGALLIAALVCAGTLPSAPAFATDAVAGVTVLRPLTKGRLQRIIDLNKSAGREALIRPEIAKAFAMGKPGDELEAQQLVVELDIGARNAFIDPKVADGSYLFSTFRPPNSEGEHYLFRVGADLRLMAAIRLDKEDKPEIMRTGDALTMANVVFDEWAQTLDLLDREKEPGERQP